MMDNLIEDMYVNIEDLIDFKEFIIKWLFEDKNMLNCVFWECGEMEFKFVINFGVVFGFIFGLI